MFSGAVTGQGPVRIAMAQHGFRYLIYHKVIKGAVAFLVPIVEGKVPSGVFITLSVHVNIIMTVN